MTEDLTIQLTRKNSGLSALAAGDRGWKVEEKRRVRSAGILVFTNKVMLSKVNRRRNEVSGICLKFLQSPLNGGTEKTNITTGKNLKAEMGLNKGEKPPLP